jgi:hypothetical protein
MSVEPGCASEPAPWQPLPVGGPGDADVVAGSRA